MRFVVVFITCFGNQPCHLTYPAPYEDFASRQSCLQLAALFDIPRFRRPDRSITCIEKPPGASD